MKYSPSECVGARKDTITGKPDPKHVSTSYVERANLAIRMSMRRFTRLTNAFSKKLTNHAHMVALYAIWYNFVRQHKTLRMSPAMAAGIETSLWTIETGCGFWLKLATHQRRSAAPTSRVSRKSRQQFQTETLPTVPIVCVLHADTLLPDDVVAVMRRVLADPATALAGFTPLLNGPDGVRWGTSFHNWIKTWHAPLLFRPRLFLRGVRLRPRRAPRRQHVRCSR